MGQETDIMKAEELMAGDWLKFPIGNEKVVDLPYIEGKGICASFAASATLFPVEIEKLEPIPLTAEILEKNGFEKHDVRVVLGTKLHFVISDDYFNVALSEHTDSIWRFEYYNAETTLHSAHLFICHVHELQRALKLCGIDLKITV